MKFLYEIYQGEACILRCIGEQERIEIPKSIDGYPVTAIGSYAFSESFAGGENSGAVCGGMLQEISLPVTVCRIGNYAFYGCRQLSQMSLGQGVKDVGGGAFTGCASLRRLMIHLEGPPGYCFKNIISELNHETEVRLIEAGTVRAKLLFPEYYEEAVENTPARILETRYHGSGYSYRQCFLDAEFKFSEYDRLFADARAWETKDFCIRLALFRLRYPKGLLQPYREQYQEYLKKYSGLAGRWLVEEDRMDDMEFLGGQIIWSEADLIELLELAGQREKLEIVGYLMDYKHLHYKKSQKSFEL